jgi:hypothetical protein
MLLQHPGSSGDLGVLPSSSGFRTLICSGLNQQPSFEDDKDVRKYSYCSLRRAVPKGFVQQVSMSIGRPPALRLSTNFKEGSKISTNKWVSPILCALR